MNSRTPLRVLSVDDDFRVADLHASLVDETPGFASAGTAHSAEAALRAVAEGSVDLALVDLYLPDRSGLALLHELCCDTMVLSAAAEGRAVRAALSAGALAYLVKPFPPAALTGRLRAYARFRELTESDGLDQSAVDQALDALRGSGRVGAQPATAQKVTRQLVLSAVEEAAGALSAGEVAAHVGVSRATAQRYLAEMVGRGVLRMRLRYGAAGRPEQEYRPV